MSQYNTPSGKDPQLWEIAQKRAAFKRHLVTYVIVNLFLWAIWLFTDGHSHGSLPWPAWASLGWGIGLAFQYFGAYVNTDNAVDKEYQKLQNK